jgi:putative transposase
VSSGAVQLQTRACFIIFKPNITMKDQSVTEDRNRPLRFPTRSHPVHGVRQTAGNATIVFVTVCTRHRAPVLATSETHLALREIWEVSATSWLVGRYVLMHDHLHLFVSPTDKGPELELWTRYWKRLLTQRLGCAAGVFMKGHWDTRIRSAIHYEEKWAYVADNPVRKGLVARPEDWPYQGGVNDLSW